MARKKGTVGERLTAARLEQGLSIREVQQMTKVQVRYLEAIEQDDFSSLPGTFYVRAFIRQYANAIGEDAEELVDIYDGKIEPYAPEPEQLPPTRTIEEVSRKRVEKPKNQTKSSLPFIVLGIFAVAILAVVFYLMFAYQGVQTPIRTDRSVEVERAEEESSSKEKKSSSTRERSTTSSSVVSRKVELSTPVVSGTQGVSLTAKNINGQAEIQLNPLQGTTWVSVMDENQRPFLEPGIFGQEQPFSPLKLPVGTKKVVVRLGRPVGAELLVNGVKVEIPSGADTANPMNFSISLEYLGETSSSN